MNKRKGDQAVSGSVKGSKKKVHWTQTPAGKAKLALRSKTIKAFNKAAKESAAALTAEVPAARPNLASLIEDVEQCRRGLARAISNLNNAGIDDLERLG